MGVPGQIRVLAEVGGVVVAEDGALVLVVDRRTGPLTVLAFVLGIVALVFGGFGALVLVAALTGTFDGGLPLPLGGGLLVVGLFAAGAVVVTLRAIRGRHARPLSEERPVAVFDRARGIFLDARGQAVAPLPQVQFQRRMQVTSSSPKLVAVTPDGKVVLAKGNPFAGGIGNLDAVLNAAVHGPIAR